jgi:YqjK-like protein
MAEARDIELARRREVLQQRCAFEREQLAQEAEMVEADLGRIDRGVKIARALTKPAIVTAGVAALTMFGPGRALKFLGRGLMLLSAARKVFNSVR